MCSSDLGRWHVFPEHAAAGLWSTPTDLAKLLVELADVWQGLSSIFLRRQTLEEMLTPQNGGPHGLGAAIAGEGASLVLMKRGQNVGYQGYLILYPGKGSDNPDSRHFGRVSSARGRRLRRQLRRRGREARHSGASASPQASAGEGRSRRGPARHRQALPGAWRGRSVSTTAPLRHAQERHATFRDRKSTRLNSSH